MACNSTCGFDTSGCTGPQADAFWSVNRVSIVEELSTIPGTTQVAMIIDNIGAAAGLTNGAKVYFEIYQEKTIGNNNIKTGDKNITGIVDASGNVKANWTITQADLNLATDKEVGATYTNYSKIYFTGAGETSGYLRLIVANQTYCSEITSCEDYKTRTECENDNMLCKISKTILKQNVGK